MKRGFRYAWPFLLVLSAAADAQHHPLAAYFGNTLVCSSAGMQCHIWFEADGSYRQYVATSSADGAVKLAGIEGRYASATRDGRTETCLLPRGIGGPMGGRPTECYWLAGRRIGDEWSVGSGEITLRFALRAGRQLNADAGFLNP